MNETNLPAGFHYSKNEFDWTTCFKFGDPFLEDMRSILGVDGSHVSAEIAKCRIVIQPEYAK